MNFPVKTIKTELAQLFATTGGKCNVESVKKILEGTGKGHPNTVIAGSIGVSRETLTAWERKCPRLAEMRTVARSHKVGEWVSVVDKAALEGDWKAADRLLQTAKETKPDWGKDQSHGKVEVNININREPIREGITIVDPE